LSNEMTKQDAEFVRSARTRLNLKQYELADMIGMERRSIIRYEQGYPLPKLVRLAIERVLDVDDAAKAEAAAKKSKRKRNGYVLKKSPSK
jgi:ribosome-binding protein aMBF1 (putative translation factor)